MLTKEIYAHCKERARTYFEKAGIAVTETEYEQFQVADYSYDIEEIGLELIVYVNTDRVCAKEMVLFPQQTCPEHLHPAVDGEMGKEETFRVRFGTVYLYVPGEPTENMLGVIPQGKDALFTCRHQIVLHPGEQYTIYPNTPHWFQGGPEGAVVSEFSTKSRDEYDRYTDPNIDPGKPRTLE